MHIIPPSNSRQEDANKSFQAVAPWADLSPDLLGHIANGIDFESYTSVRGTCPAWRRALAPVTVNPMLLIVPNEECPFSFHSTTCVTTGRSYKFPRILSYVYNSRCVGCSNGWITISMERSGGPGLAPTVFLLRNPITAVEFVLPPLIVKGNWVWKVFKVVVAPNPSKDNFIAATICGVNKIAYVTAGGTRWTVLGANHLDRFGDHLIDLVYHDPGTIYRLTSRDVYVLHLDVPRETSIVHGSGTSQQEASSAAILPTPIPVWHFRNYLSRISLTEVSDMFRTHYAEIRRMVSAASQESDLNAPSMFEPLLSASSLPYQPEAAFAQPYATLSRLISAKYLVVCESNLYQVWRYTSCSVTLRLPEGGQHRMTENDIFVLGYYPGRQPCWDVVKDLGGYSLFIGKNNAVSMLVECVPGLRGNCVYWIGGSGRDKGMVFDMETGRTAPCKSPPSDKRSLISLSKDNLD